MSDAETGLDPEPTPGPSEDLREQVELLTEAVESLQSELDEEREKRERLEAELEKKDALLKANRNRVSTIHEVLTGDTDVSLPDDVGDGLLQKVQQVEANGGVSSATLTDDVREKLLPIHEMWIDVRQGNDDRIPRNAQRRAARLFGRLIRKASGEASVGVDATYGTYSMNSDTARGILEEAGDMTETGYSTTVKRAFRELQQLSKVEDCDCDSVDACEHGLVRFESGHPNRVVADKDRFNAAMQNVAVAINGNVGSSPDDPAQQAGEGSAETDEDSSGVADAEWDRLESATHHDATEGSR